MSKRILILCDTIAPPAFAPRVVTLCRHLCRAGMDCAVFSDLEEQAEPFSAPFGEWYATKYYHRFPHLRYLADKLFGARERHFQTFIEKTVHVADFDAIVCTTCYYFPLQTTLRLAQKYHKPFIVDLRDIAEQWGDVPYRTHSISHLPWLDKWLHRGFVATNLLIRNKVLAAANDVVTISPWHKDVLSRFNPNTHLIYNGFDEQDFIPKNEKSDKFVISYSGKLYNTRFRDPRLLFAALQDLLRNQQILRKDIELVFHIDQGSIEQMRQLIADYGLQDIASVSGYIPKAQLLPLLHRSSVLLVLTCKSTPNGAHGIMGTKFFEALGVEKPVLCVRSDEECLAQVIQLTNAGLAATNVEDVKTFIRDKYHEWQTNGFTHQPVRDKHIFTRQYQAKQFESIICQLIHL